MKYAPDQIKKEFKEVLSKRNIKEFDNIMFHFIAVKVFKEINFDDYTKVGDLAWRIFIDTAKFLLHYAIVFKEVLSEIRSTSEFKEQLVEDLYKEYKLNEEHKNLLNKVVNLNRYKLDDTKEQDHDA